MTAVRSALALVALAACGDSAPSNAPGAVADRFVDLYVVEVDQRRALALTTGAARSRLEDELEQVAGVRGAGHSADSAKPRAYYDRTMLRVDAEAGRARAVYDLRLEMGGETTERHALISLSNRDGGAWKVTSFTLRDGPARSR